MASGRSLARILRCVAFFFPWRANLLESVNAERSWWSLTPTTKIDLYPIDADTYYLKLINKGRNTRLELVGFVKRWEKDSSRIMVNAKPQYVELLFALVVIGFLTAGLALLSPYLMVFSILPVIYIWILSSEIVSDIQFQLEKFLEKSD